MIKLLFLCTGNSCRSQMAEGWTRMLKSDKIEAYSAGIEKHGLNPYAVKVMAEAGVDISTQKSKLIQELPDLNFVIINNLQKTAMQGLDVKKRRCKSWFYATSALSFILPK